MAEIIDIFNCASGKKEINIIIDRYSLENDSVIRKRIESIIIAENFIATRVIGIVRDFAPSFVNGISNVQNEILNNIRNKHIFNNELLKYKNFPSGNKELAIFILCYKKARPCKILGLISDQPGATIRTLSDKNDCIWDRDDYKKQTVKVNKIICRKIIGVDFNASTDYKQCIRVSKQTLRKLFINKRCPVYGEKGQRAEFQIDHKIPVVSSKEQGIIPAVLTESMVRDGSWKEHFQILSKQANQRKQGVCSSCRRGEKIWVPPPIEEKRDEGIYIDRYEHDCTKCYWYDCEKGNK